ncbi:precorrin-2 dehydrogenase/sirohydrochlorin ferrochelatase family protein [Dorea sp. D27]|uniref:precorrin-2 dehydrogenase/sirohydrochlorin ferrochelatase family protein n=1 Tax=Dorea sp. D27 TaxID=658665 RepID=UPI0006736C01|nr:bifunctional precorrin-2 dehydrogenase/sirohydrochlorin ferrochelatase [Dorea sp. D27]KMZ55493.1 siroheme synthase [Dorea sp. D27]
MDKAYFPMFVDISDKEIVVVGGGSIAVRRVKTLLLFSDHITVIAPGLHESLLDLEARGRIACLHRAYREGDISKAHIVLAATDNKELNRSIGEECNVLGQAYGRKILFNTADDRTFCDFYFPAVVQSDDIVIGINSGGKNPAKVKEIRRRLESGPF